MKPLNKLEAREALIYTLYVYIHRSCKIYITSEYRNIILHQENHQSNPKPFCPKIGQLHLLALKRNGYFDTIYYSLQYGFWSWMFASKALQLEMVVVLVEVKCSSTHYYVSLSRLSWEAPHKELADKKETRLGS